MYKETLTHTVCAKCGKPVDLYMSSEQFKSALRNENRVHCDNCFDRLIAYKDTPTTPEPMPQAAVNEPGDKGVQLGAFGVPDRIIVVKAPECQGRLFDDNLLET